MKCPRCKGEMRIVDPENGYLSDDGKQPCPTCEGNGKVGCDGDEYITLQLPKSGLEVVVKIEEEGVVVDVFDSDDEVVETTYKFWYELVNDGWGITLLELLNKQHNPEFI